MQSKIMVTAAFAASSVAMKLEPSKTVLAQDKHGFPSSNPISDDHGHHGDDHHGYEVDPEDPCKSYHYSYECLAKKVEDTLTALIVEVDDHREECNVAANELKEQILASIDETVSPNEINYLNKIAEALGNSLDNI